MKGKFNFQLGVLCAILALVLVVPALAQPKGEMGGQLKEMKGQILKQLKLAPDKEKAFMAADDKFAAERQKIIAGLKQSQKDLEAALEADKPDPAKINDLVCALTAGQDKLFASFKNQRDEELALLSPVQRGKYLLAMSQWRHQMMEKCMKEEAGQKMKEAAPEKK
jgi:Spy/CpxP family protein refolding chaperone